MQVKTILNRLQKHRGFVYGTVQLEEQIAGLALTVEIAPHRRNRPRCASCGQASAVYDRLALRRFEFVPLWGLRVFFLYPMRRVDCPRCGVTVERVPWADGKHQLTTTYMWFLARWAKCLSWQEVARVFRTSWDQVFRSVAMAVAWGRDHVDLTGIRAIGIDEIHWQRGSQFLTLVYQIETSPVGVVVFEARTGALVSLNREAARIVQDLCGPGQSAEQLLGVITCRRADGREIALDRLPLAPGAGPRRDGAGRGGRAPKFALLSRSTNRRCIRRSLSMSSTCRCHTRTR